MDYDMSLLDFVKDAVFRLRERDLHDAYGHQLQSRKRTNSKPLSEIDSHSAHDDGDGGKDDTGSRTMKRVKVDTAENAGKDNVEMVGDSIDLTNDQTSTCKRWARNGHEDVDKEVKMKDLVDDEGQHELSELIRELAWKLSDWTSFLKVAQLCRPILPVLIDKWTELVRSARVDCERGQPVSKQFFFAWERREHVREDRTALSP